MRKILLVLMVQLVLFSAFAQKHTAPKNATAKAVASKPSKPTKEETMDWLATKMQERLKAPRQFVSYSKGIFVYKKPWGSTNVYCTSTIDLNKLTAMSPEYSIDISISGNGLLHTVCDGSSGVEYVNDISIGGNNYHDYSDPFDFKMDNNLLERVVKAYRSLMDYNSSKQTEGEAY